MFISVIGLKRFIIVIIGLNCVLSVIWLKRVYK